MAADFASQKDSTRLGTIALSLRRMAVHIANREAVGIWAQFLPALGSDIEGVP